MFCCCCTLLHHTVRECFDAMTEAQRNRLEAYIRSNLQKKTMKKVRLLQ